MNWLALILAFCISAVMGAFFARLAGRNRPGWSARRRLWTAALILPFFIGLLTFTGLAWVLAMGSGTGDNMQGLALVVTASVGGIFAAIALGGGLVGASLEARGGRE